MTTQSALAVRSVDTDPTVCVTCNRHSVDVIDVVAPLHLKGETQASVGTHRLAVLCGPGADTGGTDADDSTTCDSFPITERYPFRGWQATPAPGATDRYWHDSKTGA